MINNEEKQFIEASLSEINELNAVISNKINALNSYYAKELKKYNDSKQKEKDKRVLEDRKIFEDKKEASQKEKRVAIPTKDIDKGRTEKAILKKPNDKKSQRKSSTPNKKGNKRG